MNRMNLLYTMDNLLENCKTCERRDDVKHFNPVKVCNGCETYAGLRDIGDKLGEERKMGKAISLKMEQYQDYKAKGLTDSQVAEELGCTPTTISNWKKKHITGSHKPNTEVKTQSETKDIQEDLKAENGRLKRLLNVSRMAVEDLKEENEKLLDETVKLGKDKKALQEECFKEHSRVIQLDCELENKRDELRQAREESVKYGKENEHLWGLLKIKMEG